MRSYCRDGNRCSRSATPQYIIKLPKAERELPEWETAIEWLMLVGEHGGDAIDPAWRGIFGAGKSDWREHTTNIESVLIRAPFWQYSSNRRPTGNCKGNARAKRAWRRSHGAAYRDDAGAARK
jgi:hypothetical protein